MSNFKNITFGKDKKKVYEAKTKIKPNDIYGGIFTVSSTFANKFKQCENKMKMDGIKADDIVETHAKITGNWCF